ncbi:hypothetical protein WMO79_01290 [Micrococcaceae bacterium Sec7.4]
MSGGGLPHTACAVCGHVLNLHSSAFGDNWVHALEEDKDHPAVPVSSGSIRTITLCDFCLAPDAAWVLPVEDYRVPGGENVGDWQCCAGCAAFLERTDWAGLTQRAMDAARGRVQAEEIRPAVFEAMYSQLREHITGPVRLVHTKGTP